MTDVLTQVLADLAAEGDRLEALVRRPRRRRLAHADPRRRLGRRRPRSRTSPGPTRWRSGPRPTRTAWDAVVIDAIADPEGYVDEEALALARDARPAAPAGAAPAATSAPRWRRTRSGEKMPWFGPPMSATSMATARLMETWAHSLDVHDGLGAPVDDTDRIRHVAHLGVRTRNFAFAVHGLDAPAEEFRIDLVSPSERRVDAGGPEDAAQTLTGSAGDFCRLVTQRVHRADTDLVATGADVDRWLDIAQAFAGQPGEGRAAAMSGSQSDRIGNCSGFYGDRLSAMREMLEGGPSSTSSPATTSPSSRCSSSARTSSRTRPSATPAPSSARSRTASASRSSSGVKIVANAGGLNPAGLADKLREVATGLGLDPQVAHVEGDDVRAPAASTTPSPPTPTSAASASRPR